MNRSSGTDGTAVYLTVYEAARVVGLSHRTLERLRECGQGPRYYKLGRAVRYRRDDLEQWAAGCARDPAL